MNSSSLILPLLLFIILIFISYLIFFKKINYQKYTNTKEYLKKNFSNYKIEKEIIPSNKNKTFLLSKDSVNYILKLSYKGKKKINIEATLLNDLQSYLPVPELISYNSRSIPGHIFMEYCGKRIATVNDESYYFRLGKLIPNIGKVPLKESTRNLLKHNKSKKVKKLLSQSHDYHPYKSYLKLYKSLPQTYFSHGDLNMNQILIQKDKLTVIDWESACFNYRVFDLSRALSHCLIKKTSIDLAASILKGYISVSELSDQNELKLLLGLIWCRLERSNLRWRERNIEHKRANFIQPLLNDNILENIFNLHISNN